MGYIMREVYVQRIGITNPIPYTRATNAQDIQFRFCDFHIPEGAEAKVYVQKPSGKAVYNTALIQGDIVTIEVTTQMFSELGTSNIQLQLVKEERILVTFTQPVEVFQNYTEGDAMESQNESGFFGEFVKETGEKAVKIAQDAANEIERRADEGEFTGTVEIGEVVTGEPGSEASVENVGTAKDAVLNMTIPAGKTGEVENIDSVQVEFEEAAERENIESGETMPTLFGKIRKWFSGLKSIAFTASYDDLIDAPDPTAVKGDKESFYRTGDVNLTCADIGAIPTEKIVESTNITEPGFIMDGKTASEALDELNRNSIVEDVQLSLNSSEYTNNTWAQKCGKEVAVYIFIVGIPKKNSIIATGLPAPKRKIFLRNSAFGILELNTSGTLLVNSPANSTGGYFYTPFTYFTE